MRLAVTRLLALLLLAGLAAGIAAYPLSPVLLALPLAAYGLLLWKYPPAWLLVVPALLPVFDLAPWTGWFFLEELDLLLLATAAVLYWRVGAARAPAVFPAFFRFAMGLLMLAVAIAAVTGVLPLAPLDMNAFSNYSSRYNSLRVAKGFLWALLLWPLLRATAGEAMANVRRWFVPGMLGGLALTCLCVVAERYMFPGLLNFSSDYRPTAPFSAMHTGGAALDAYLAISFPFLALWLLDGAGRWRTAFALGLLMLACYAGFATFSRDMYLAYATAGVVIGLMVLGHRLRRGTLSSLRIGAVVLLLALAGVALNLAFGSSGYRGLLAALGVLGAATLLGSELRRIPLALGAGAGLTLLLACAALASLADKGAYLAYALAALVCVAGLLLRLAGPAALQRLGLALAAAAFPSLLLGALAVAMHWGGQAALADMGWLAAFAVTLLAASAMRRIPAWQLDGATIKLTAFCGIVFAIAIPISGSYYTGTRFATVGGDIDIRLRHWNEALEMMRPDLQTSLLGMGLGRYPATYFWSNTHGETPGTQSYELEQGARGPNSYLRLTAPQYASNVGDVLRMLQQVDMKPGLNYQLSLDVRRQRGNAELLSAVCSRWLIFPEDCASTAIKLAPADGTWQHYSATLASGRLGTGLLAAPTRLALAADGRRDVLDIDNVSLRAPDGTELIKNGAFSAGHDWWFFSSDRNHFPWHVKNFFVNSYFEMGWLGVAALALLGLYAAGTLAARGLDGELYASVSLAALAAFLVVGLFDSLIDVPRLTLAAMLVLGAAVMKVRPPKRKRRRKSSAVEAKTAAVPA